MRSFSYFMAATSANFKKTGYQKTDHLWFRGDCLDLLKRLPDESIQLVITSPPYGINKEYEEGLSLSEQLVLQRDVINECHRVVAKNGSICWQVGSYVNNGEVVPLDILIYKHFQNLRMKLRNRVIWHYEHGHHATYRFSGRYETVLWFTKSDDYFFNVDPVRVPQKQPTKKYWRGPKKGQLSCNPLGKNPGDVWKITNIKHGHPEKLPDSHPCQFPIALAERFILSMTKPGDAVLDPFGGVATTVVAALRNGRVGIGAEIEKKYHQAGQARIKAALKENRKPTRLFKLPDLSL